MSIGIDYPVVSTGNTYTAIDTYNSALLNNGAQNVLGSVYLEPLNPARVGTAANGSGLQRYVKYVRYNPTVSQTILTGPAPVYWKDETFTDVTPLQSEAFYAGANSIAGWLEYNTTTLSTATAAQINGNYCFICVGGFLPGCIAAATTAVGDVMIGGTAAFTPVRIAAGAAFTARPIGFALTAISSLLSDMYVPFLN